MNMSKVKFVLLGQDSGEILIATYGPIESEVVPLAKKAGGLPINLEGAINKAYQSLIEQIYDQGVE